MSKKWQNSLEEIVRKGGEIPGPIKLDDFETKIRRIARRYGGEDTIHQEGSHRDIRIEGKRIGWSPRQIGHEQVLSRGVFEEAIERISEATHIPLEQLEFYFKGAGKPYKRYERRFRKEYDL